jgi:DNA-binding beta-propeller fold protein YncE
VQILVYNAYNIIRHSNYVSILSGSTNKVLGQGTVSPAFDSNIGNVYVTNFNSNGFPGNTVYINKCICGKAKLVIYCFNNGKFVNRLTL